ncbi:MAG: hypothetical protein KAR09_07965 [Bacteroidales bacterium]|nr:hypothetical protein [Bacteroidales bacterium]
MKFRISIPFLLTALLLGVFLFTSSSCSQNTYSTHSKVSYNRSSRIKAYKKPANRRSFTHTSSPRKKYVIKK